MSEEFEDDDDSTSGIAMRMVNCAVCKKGGLLIMASDNPHQICEDCQKKGLKPKEVEVPSTGIRHRVICKQCTQVIFEIMAFQSRGIEFTVHECVKCGNTTEKKSFLIEKAEFLIEEGK